MAHTTVIGVGNTLMGDDGVGVRVVRELLARFPDAGPSGALELVEGCTAGMGLMGYVLASDRVIFIDAVSIGDTPGSLYRFDPDAVGLTELRSNTSHGVGIPYLITCARLQGHWPEFIVYGVQVGDVMYGPDCLSGSVEATVPALVELVCEEIGTLVG